MQTPATSEPRTYTDRELLLALLNADDREAAAWDHRDSRRIREDRDNAGREAMRLSRVRKDTVFKIKHILNAGTGPYNVKDLEAILQQIGDMVEAKHKTFLQLVKQFRHEQKEAERHRSAGYVLQEIAAYKRANELASRIDHAVNLLEQGPLYKQQNLFS